jgi:tricarballylate dehydrogenase
MADMRADERADVVVIGGGVAGLSAALSAVEEASSSSRRVVLLEKAPPEEAGGNTRWTDAYFRLEDVYEPADGFVEDMIEFSRGKTDRAYVERLVDALPEAMEWVQAHGVRFHRRATYFVTASRPRMMPVGGGEALVRLLTEACEKNQVEIWCSSAVTALERDDDGFLVTVGAGPDATTIAARACIVACGGFEGDSQRLGRHLGEAAATMKPIAPGGRFNTGEVLEMVRELGGAWSGEWSGFHGEPVDARSTQAEASVMVFPYGILVDRDARRFTDEGAGTVDESYEDLARAILALPGSAASLIGDASFLEVPGVERGLLSDRKPIRADTLQELAEQLGLDAEALRRTVEEYNAAVVDGAFDATRPDGCHTEGLTPPKTNWASRIERPPYVGIPLITDIVFTYGGVATDADARVVDESGAPVRGLYAAGECTGVYHHKYPGATSVLRGLVFGRLAGIRALRDLDPADG